MLATGLTHSLGCCTSSTDRVQHCQPLSLGDFKQQSMHSCHSLKNVSMLQEELAVSKVTSPHARQKRQILYNFSIQKKKDLPQRLLIKQNPQWLAAVMF